MIEQSVRQPRDREQHCDHHDCVDELFVRGAPADLATFVASARLLEIDRIDPAPVASGLAAATLAIFCGEIAAIVAAACRPCSPFWAPRQ